jgi:hypothetical protein
MLTPSSVSQITFAFVGGSCCPTLDFVIAFWTTIAFYTLLTSLFCICSKSAKTICNYNQGEFKVFQSNHGTQWDKVDFYKEWFRGGDLNTIQDIWAFLL